MFDNDYVPEYTGQGEKVKNPKIGETTTQGVMVSGVPIDTELLYKLAAYGATNYELADFFGVGEAQIRYYFTHYLSKARSALKIKLRRAQIKVALEGQATMLIWLGKNLLNQSDSPYTQDDDKVLPWTAEQKQEITEELESELEEL